MNPTKSQYKIDLTESFGRKFEEMEKEAENSFYRQEGARDSLKLAAKRVGELGEHIDKDVEGGVLNEVVGEPLKVAAYVKKWLNRAVGAIDNLATQAEASRIAVGGRRQGLCAAKEYTHKIWNEEREKLRAYQDALQKVLSDGDGENDDVDGRRLDGHPGPTLKSQRMIESTKERRVEEKEVEKEDEKKVEAKKKSSDVKSPSKKRRKPTKKVSVG